MKPTDYPLECWQGKTFRQHFEFTDAYGNVLNLSGYTARMQVRQNFDAEDVLVELSTENDRIIIDEEHGYVDLYIEDSVTEEFTAGNYRYDIELITSGGDVLCPLYGKFKVLREVTR